MSYNVESIINHILDDDANPRRFVKDPCGICNKTIKSGQLALQCNFCMHINHQIHGYCTRFNFNVNDGIIINNLFVPSSNYGLKQLKVNGPRIWNELPASLKNASCLNIFLKNLKMYYIS